MLPLGLVVFAVTYVLISVGRLRWLGFDRPAAALLGAVACVVLGVLAPDVALAAVDGSTLLLLFAVMGMGAFLAVDGFFDQAERALVAKAKTRAQLLAVVVWSSGILSALVTNDAVCVLGAPLVVRLIRRYRLPPLPFVIGLATSANTGSVATLVGNPQNMLCAQLGALSYREHLVLMGPVALLSLLINHGLLLLMFRGALSEPLGSLSEVASSDVPDAAAERRSLFTLAVICATAIFYVFGGNLAWTAAAGFVLLMLVHRRDTRELWPRIDWALLLFFSGLFVVVAGLMKSGVPEALFARFPLVPAAAAQVEAGALSLVESLRLSSIFLAGSNVVSNVPFILVVEREMASLPNPRMAWELLAMASTFAGNLTLLGSAANIIVAEAAQDVGGIGFLQHLRVGLPLTLLTTLLGALWLAFVGSALG